MKLKRITAVLLALIASLCVFAPQAQAASEKSETVYALLNHDGSVDNIYVVNQLNGEYTDYGVYSQIKNLSTDSEPVVEGDSITFPDKNVEGGLYYQGTMQGELPFTFAFKYYLDGRNVSAEQLAGASGQLEIRIKGAVNDKCDERVRDGYMAQITLALDLNRVSSIVSQGAVMVNAGRTVNVSYTVLPGKSAEYILKAKVNDFEMDGISITLLKGTVLGMEDTISETEEGFDDMLSGAEDMVDGTYELKDGMTSLKGGLKSLNAGMSKLSSAGSEILAGMQQYCPGLSDYIDGVAGLSFSSAEIKDGLSALAANAPNVSAGISNINAGLGELSSSSTDLRTLAQSLLLSPDPNVQALAQGMLQTLDSVDDLSSGLDDASEGVYEFAAGVQGAAAGYTEFDAGLSELSAGGSQLKEGCSDMTEGFKAYLEGIKSSARGVKRIYNSISDLPDDIQKLIDGQTEFKDGIASAKDEILAQTQNFVADDSPAISFASPGKNHPKSVQYILKTPAIKVKEEKVKVTQEQGNETFFTRLADLFS